MFDGRVTTEFSAGTFSQEQLVAAMVGHELADRREESPMWPTISGPADRAGLTTTSRRGDGQLDALSKPGAADRPAPSDGVRPRDRGLRPAQRNAAGSQGR